MITSPETKDIRQEIVRWLSDSSNVCLFQHLYSQAMLQMLDWVYLTGSYQILFVFAGKLFWQVV